MPAKTPRSGLSPLEHAIVKLAQARALAGEAFELVARGGDQRRLADVAEAIRAAEARLATAATRAHSHVGGKTIAECRSCQAAFDAIGWEALPLICIRHEQDSERTIRLEGRRCSCGAEIEAKVDPHAPQR